MENWYILLAKPASGLCREFWGRTTDIELAIDHLNKGLQTSYHRPLYTTHVMVVTDKTYQLVSDSSELRKAIS